MACNRGVARERLDGRRMIYLNQPWHCFLGALALLTSIPAFAAPDRVVVMISVDGLAGYYLDDPKAEMPNIRALAAGGARAKGMKASNPSVTWPNHTTLVTGVTPAKHGVVGNNYYDRSQKQRITLIMDPVYDKEEIVKAPTLYDLAHADGRKTTAINWPATRNAQTLDWTLPEVRVEQLFLRYATPSLLADCKTAGIVITEESAQIGAFRRGDGSTDLAYAQALNLVLEKHRPQFALLHLGNVDHTEHANGPKSPEAYAAIQAADEQVGLVWKTLEKNFPGKATLVIVSDHGFSPIKHAILPNVVLRQAGIIQLDGKKVSSDAPVQVVVQGGSALVYILDDAHRAEIAAKIQKAFRNVKGMERVVKTADLGKYGLAQPKDDPNSPDMMLFAKFGHVFGDTAAGDLPFEDKPERRGSHGHLADFPELHATFVAWGAGIKAGARLGEINNTDVAPTVAKLLGLKLPDQDGKVLKTILAE